MRCEKKKYLQGSDHVCFCRLWLVGVGVEFYSNVMDIQEGLI